MPSPYPPVRMIGGIQHKLCTGPVHEEPTWLPATDKYFYRYRTPARKGRFISRCRLCHNWARLKNPPSHRGLVRASAVRPAYIELVARIGMTEAARRTGITAESLLSVINGKTMRVRKGNAVKVVLELVSVKRKNEFSANKLSQAKHRRRLANGATTCKGCGTTLDNYTLGCDVCSGRRQKRAYLLTP